MLPLVLPHITLRGNIAFLCYIRHLAALFGCVLPITSFRWPPKKFGHPPRPENGPIGPPESRLSCRVPQYIERPPDARKRLPGAAGIGAQACGKTGPRSPQAWRGDDCARQPRTGRVPLSGGALIGDAATGDTCHPWSTTLSRTPPIEGLAPAVMRWARESAGMTLADVAGRLGKPQALIQTWEDGTSGPTYAQLEKLGLRALQAPPCGIFPARPAQRTIAPARIPHVARGRSRLTIARHTAAPA